MSAKEKYIYPPENNSIALVFEATGESRNNIYFYMYIYREKHHTVFET